MHAKHCLAFESGNLLVGRALQPCHHYRGSGSSWVQKMIRGSRERSCLWPCRCCTLTACLEEGGKHTASQSTERCIKAPERERTGEPFFQGLHAPLSLENPARGVPAAHAGRVRPRAGALEICRSLQCEHHHTLSSHRAISHTFLKLQVPQSAGPLRSP